MSAEEVCGFEWVDLNEDLHKCRISKDEHDVDLHQCVCGHMKWLDEPGDPS